MDTMTMNATMLNNDNPSISHAIHSPSRTLGRRLDTGTRTSNSSANANATQIDETSKDGSTLVTSLISKNTCSKL